MDKVFCIGFPKTGTTSLENALSILGYKVCSGHYNNHTNYLISLYLEKNFNEIDRIVKYYDAFADLPWGGTDFYKYLSQKYPEAKFIHTQREVESWYKSFENMITQVDENLETAMDSFHKNGRYGLIYFIRSAINVNSLSGQKQIFIDYYSRLNDEILNHFKTGNFKYLRLNIIDGERWEPLCVFLDKKMPDVPFPHNNITKAEAAKKKATKFNKIKPLIKKIVKILIS